jgi:hypothetical protein
LTTWLNSKSYRLKIKHFLAVICKKKCFSLQANFGCHMGGNFGFERGKTYYFEGGMGPNFAEYFGEKNTVN